MHLEIGIYFEPTHPHYELCFRSLELQSDLICIACHLCYMHTENDRLAVNAVPTSGVQADNVQPPLNTTALSDFGGSPCMLASLCSCPTEQARRCILAVLLDVARDAAVASEPTLGTFFRSDHSTRCCLHTFSVFFALALLALTPCVPCGHCPVIAAIAECPPLSGFHSPLFTALYLSYKAMLVCLLIIHAPFGTHPLGAPVVVHC
jgi:hypothetical protein